MSSHEAAQLASFGRQLLALIDSIVLTVLLQLALFRRMGPERRAQGWNGVTWASAVYAIGPLSMIGFCWVTRRYRGVARGAVALGTGVLWVFGLAVIITLIDQVYAMAFGLER